MGARASPPACKNKTRAAARFKIAVAVREPPFYQLHADEDDRAPNVCANADFIMESHRMVSKFPGRIIHRYKLLYEDEIRHPLPFPASV